MRRNSISAKLGTTSNCPSDSIQLGLLQARSIYPPAQYCVELLQWSLWRRGRQFMAITREQIKAENKRGSAAIARGPVARAARYDARRALIVISLEGGCEFSFPTALAEGRTHRVQN
jgi:hypothetical protein